MQRFKSFDGVELAYDVSGDGPPVLLLHGFAADSEVNWVRPHVVDVLMAGGRRVVTLDARGHGQSERPHEPEAYPHGAMEQDVQALLDHLEITQVDVCGYSMGSMTTAAFVGRDARARSAVLGGVGSRLGSAALIENAGRIADGLLEEDPDAIADPTARGFRAFADYMDADHRALAAIMRARSMSPRDPVAIDLPTLVISGEADTLLGSPAKLAARIPGSVLKFVSGDHMTAVFDPRFARTILEFLAGVDSRR